MNIKDSQQDGYIFAVLLKCLKSGLHTYQIAYKASYVKYEPYLSNEFEQSFFEGVQNG